MIEVSNLTKRYGLHTAINNLNFTVNEGEILGFLGPNGAGKTTTMNIMTGYISSTEGTVKIDGYDILEKPELAKKQIGYLPDVPPLYNDMTVIEYLNFVCDIKKVKKSERKAMLDNIINIVKINEVKDRITKNLSKGYRQRVGLAQALIGYPEVIILDEPTNGLDPKQIIEMRDVIKELSKKHTVILSSHILSEVSAVCDRVMIISKGQIVASDTPENLSKALTKDSKIAVRIKGNKSDIQNAINEIQGNDGFTINLSTETGACDVEINVNEDFDIREALFNKMAEKKLPILMMKPMSLTLEEIFLKVTQEDKIVTDEKLNVDKVNIQESDIQFETPNDNEKKVKIEIDAESSEEPKIEFNELFENNENNENDEKGAE